MGETDGSHRQDAPDPSKDLHSWMSYKRLEQGRFVWPSTGTGRVSLTPAQLSMLLEGIDWRMPVRIRRPELAG
jgi:transposase